MALWQRTRSRVRAAPIIEGARQALLRDESREVARRARRQAFVLGPAFAGVLIAYDHRRELFGKALEDPIRAATVIALVILGWALARDIGRALGPVLLGRVDPATAGTIGFLIRLAAVAISLAAALHVAGITPRTLAVGGAFTAVIVGL